MSALEKTGLFDPELVLRELDAAHLSTGLHGETTFSAAANVIRKLDRENRLLRGSLTDIVTPLLTTE